LRPATIARPRRGLHAAQGAEQVGAVPASFVESVVELFEQERLSRVHAAKFIERSEADEVEAVELHCPRRQTERDERGGLSAADGLSETNERLGRGRIATYGKPG
jgi:hypothetical protein